MSALALALVGALAAAPTVEGAGPWRRVSEEDGVLLEAQKVKGSALERLRASTRVQVPPSRMLELMWGDGTLKDASPGVSTRELLEDEPRLRVYYETVSAPLVSARDYVLRVVQDPARFTLRFHTVEDPRRPPRKGVVRMPRIVGESRADPVPGEPGAARVVHIVFSDPGGAIPAFLASGGQRGNMVAWLKELRDRAARASPPPAER